MEIKTPPNVDIREALYNDRRVGHTGQIQLPLERITTLHGILFDLDPKWLIPGHGDSKIQDAQVGKEVADVVKVLP